MATQKTLVVTIGKDSDASFEADGFPDGSCLKEMEEVAKALGTVTKQVKKPEALRTAKQTVTLGKK